MKKFTDLKFGDHPNATGLFGPFSTQATLFFENGYGVSVITGEGAYGNADQYELAVLVGTDEDFSLTYDTPVTDDVLGHLSKADVTRLLKDVEALPKH